MSNCHNFLETLSQLFVSTVLFRLDSLIFMGISKISSYTHFSLELVLIKTSYLSFPLPMKSCYHAGSYSCLLWISAAFGLQCTKSSSKRIGIHESVFLFLRHVLPRSGTLPTYPNIAYRRKLYMKYPTQRNESLNPRFCVWQSALEFLQFTAIRNIDLLMYFYA